MNSTWFFFIFLSIIGGIAFLIHYFSRKQIVKRKLKKAVGIPMSSFQTGDIAKVAGKVEYQGNQLIAPLSGRPCCFYQVKVERLESSGKSSSWRTIIKEEESMDFFIRDGRNRAYVERGELKAYLVQDWNTESGFRHDANSNMETILSRHGYSSENFLGMNHSIRYHEGVLEMGETIAAVGRGEWKRGTDVGLNTPERVLVISATDKESVYLSDDPETVEINYQGLTEVPGAKIENQP